MASLREMVMLAIDLRIGFPVFTILPAGKKTLHTIVGNKYFHCFFYQVKYCFFRQKNCFHAGRLVCLAVARTRNTGKLE